MAKTIKMNGIDVTNYFTPRGMKVVYEKICGQNGGVMLSGDREEDILAWKAKVTLQCMPLTEIQQADFLTKVMVDDPTLCYFDPRTNAYRTIYYIADVAETTYKSAGGTGVEFWTGLVLTAQEKTAFYITEQPEDYTCSVGQSYSFHCDAEGKGLSFQWYYIQRNGTVKIPTSASAQTKTYTVNTAKTTYDGYRFYCIITDVSGATLQTETVTLTVTE